MKTSTIQDHLPRVFVKCGTKKELLKKWTTEVSAHDTRCRWEKTNRIMFTDVTTSWQIFTYDIW
jgi:hypothetical protein